MAHLRGVEGCPWDRAQDYDSMKGLLLEEAYEVIDAVNARNFIALEDELGDLLFQVVFYAQLAEEDKRFNLNDVMERLHAKLVRRHPHVFGEARAQTPAEALKSWNIVKEKEREGDLHTGSQAGHASEALQRTTDNGSLTTSLLDGIPKTLPATLEAYELGVRASEVGFDWAKVEDLLDKVEEELAELRSVLASCSVVAVSRKAEFFPSPRPLAPSPCSEERRYSEEEIGDYGSAVRARRYRFEEEVGDLLFAASNLARYLRSDAESCLRRANQKFRRRFQALEKEVAKRGKRVRDCTLEELDGAWNELKAREVDSKR